jgi:hypothetical protein
VRHWAGIAVLSLLFSIGGCASPESERTRGGGRGADVGNRGKIVRMHEGAEPYANTPKVMPAKHPSLESARHADQLSRK